MDDGSYKAPDYNTNYVVSPYGQTNAIQAGVKVKRGRSLRDLLGKSTDASQMEMNPEAYTSLKERMLRDAD